MRKIIILSAATLILSSCGIYNKYKPVSEVPEGLYGSESVAATDTANFGNLSWKEVFTDPYLQNLIDSALVRNTDMQTAHLRVKEAEASLMTSKLSYLPSLFLAPEGAVSSFDRGKATQTYSLPVTASWELDIFGKVTTAKRRAKAAYEQSKEYEQAVKTQLVSSVANTYYTLLMLDRQVEITAKTVDIYKENVRVMEAMKIAGMATEAAVTQMRAAYHQVSGSLIELESQVRSVENSLSVLLAKAPQQIDRGTLEEQVMPEDIMVGVPLQLLENRPDVKIAEMTLASAYYTTNKARAAFYPGLNITATAGWTNGSGISVANPGQFMFQALASLAQPIFNNGKLVANLKVSKAEEKIAQMNYQQTILEAGKEVSDALHQYDATSKKLVQDRAQIEQLEKAVAYTSALFQSAQSTYLEILSAQQSLLSAQLTEVSDNVQRMQAVVSLYSAIGGGRE